MADRLRVTGLDDVNSEGRILVWRGKAPGATVLRANFVQLHDAMIAAKLISQEEFAADTACLEDPNFMIPSLLLWAAWGRVRGRRFQIDLRLLGIARDISLAPLKRLFRIMWLGFAIQAASGVLLCSLARQSLTNPDFCVKLTLMGFAVWAMPRLKRPVFDDSSLSKADMKARRATLAKWALFLWIGVITARRLLAYIDANVTFR